MEFSKIGATELQNPKCIEIVITRNRVTYEADNFSGI